MKKQIASIVFIVAFAGYAISQQLSTTTDVYAATGGVTPVAATQTATQAATTQKKTTASTGQYKDGTYTGTAVSAYYGTVQVQAIISGGRLADVQFLQYPSDRSTSRSINQRAMNGLAQEAIAAQSANVSGVSGATDTTSAFRQSLSSALASAKA